MFEVDELVKLGLFNHMIPMWQVFFFIAALLPFLLCNRVKLCLLITYLFTFYLGFLVQWGDYLATSGTLLPFVVYAFSGIVITVIFVLLIYRDEGGKLPFKWKRGDAVLRPYNPEDLSKL